MAAGAVPIRTAKFPGVTEPAARVLQGAAAIDVGLSVIDDAIAAVERSADPAEARVARENRADAAARLAVVVVEGHAAGVGGRANEPVSARRAGTASAVNVGFAAVLRIVRARRGLADVGTADLARAIAPAAAAAPGRAPDAADVSSTIGPGLAEVLYPVLAVPGARAGDAGVVRVANRSRAARLDSAPAGLAESTRAREPGVAGAPRAAGPGNLPAGLAESTRTNEGAIALHSASAARLPRAAAAARLGRRGVEDESEHGKCEREGLHGPGLLNTGYKRRRCKCSRRSPR